MAFSSRYDGITSERLLHAFALQEIEGNPASDEELDQYRRMQAKGWSDARQSKFVLWQLNRKYCKYRTEESG